MKRSRLFGVSGLALFFLIGWPCRGQSAPLDELLTAAKKEGIVDFSALHRLDRRQQ